MKKLIFSTAIVFCLSPVLNAEASEADRACHEMAQVIADGSGAEGAAYADVYMTNYEFCMENMW